MDKYINKIAKSNIENEEDYKSLATSRAVGGTVAARLAHGALITKLLSDLHSGKLDTDEFEDLQKSVKNIAEKHDLKLDVNYTDSALKSNAVPYTTDKLFNRLRKVIGDDVITETPLREFLGSPEDLEKRIAKGDIRVNLPQTNKAIAYHELGHAKNIKKGKPRIAFYNPLVVGAASLATLPMINKKVRDKIKKIDGDHKVMDKVVDTIDKAPELLFAAPSLPRLIEEASASTFATKELVKELGRKEGLKRARKALLPAYGTYVTKALVPTLALGGAYRVMNAKHRINKKEKKAHYREMIMEKVAMEKVADIGPDDVEKVLKTMVKGYAGAAIGSLVGGALTEDKHKFKRNQARGALAGVGLAIGGPAAYNKLKDSVPYSKLINEIQYQKNKRALRKWMKEQFNVDKKKEKQLKLIEQEVEQRVKDHLKKKRGL